MKKSFIKMQGLGNDYVYFNCFDKDINLSCEQIKRLADRNFGIGGDGVVLIKRSKIADAKMVMYNSDGSEGSMCGNAIRCVARFLFDSGLVKKQKMDIETKSGVKRIEVLDELIKVDMGVPVFGDIESVRIDGEDYCFRRVSMGNPHAVVFVDDVGCVELKRIGPLFEHHALFSPDRVNTEFVEVVDRNYLRMRVWERGSGETMACGTGACAAAVAAVLENQCDRGADIKVRLDGGDLIIRCEGDKVFMTGAAEKVFEGVVEINND